MRQVSIPSPVRELLEAPNYAHLSTLGRDGSPRNHVVWVWVDGEDIIVATHDWSPKAKDMQADPRVALSVADIDDPYRMAALTGQVLEVLPDDGYRLLDRIARKYTGKPYPAPGAGLVYFRIGVENAYQRTLGGLQHHPEEVTSPRD